MTKTKDDVHPYTHKSIFDSRGVISNFFFSWTVDMIEEGKKADFDENNLFRV